MFILFLKVYLLSTAIRVFDYNIQRRGAKKTLGFPQKHKCNGLVRVVDTAGGQSKADFR